MRIAVAGAGAFGTGLAIALAANEPVTLWARDPDAAAAIQSSRVNARRLPDAPLPDGVSVTADIARLLDADIILLAIPLQKMRDFCKTNAAMLQGKTLVACSKGIELSTGAGPSAILAENLPDTPVAVLTGPSFAADIARGLPTALTLACAALDTDAAYLQQRLSTPVLRLYLTDDRTGAELGGSIKNVIAIACGACIGAGFGESARAALITRGFAEIQRVGQAYGAHPHTLAGLSGLGDLVLTCTSAQSRNTRFGTALGQGKPWDSDETVEGVATAQAIAALAHERDLDLPICQVVAGLVTGKIDTKQAVESLLRRPLKEE